MGKERIKAYTGNENYLFISYAHKDEKDVLSILKVLNDYGYRAWYDEGIEAGSDWASKIGENLLNAKVMLLFLSKNSVKSENVLREIAFAEENKIPILTIQMGKVKLSSDLEKKLLVNQFINLKGLTYTSFVEKLSSPLLKYEVKSKDNIKVVNPKYDKKIKLHVDSKAGKIVLAIVLAIILLIIGKVLLTDDVPYVIGMEAEEASNTVAEAGFNCNIAMEYSETEEYGYIFEQNRIGSALKILPVIVTQSMGSGNNLVEMPKLVGFTISDGISKLVNSGMTHFKIDPVVTTEYAISYISKQSIPYGYMVSKDNTVLMDVSSKDGSVSFTYDGKEYTINGESQLEVTDDGLKITATQIYAIQFEFNEEDKLSDSVSSSFSYKMDVKREDTEPYGAYRGWMIMRGTVSGIGKDISFSATANPFTFKMEEFDQAKYEAFVKEATGLDNEAKKYTKPIAMYLGNDITLTNKETAITVLRMILNSANNFVVSLPTINGNELTQPFSIIVLENGTVYVNFYSNSGENRTMQISSTIKIG